jgi:tetratricopeptide (TPR) repeat protein
VAYSPDGRRLATASVDQTVRLWDAATGQELLALKGHTDRVNAVAFSPDGRRLASAAGGEPSRDRTVRVWETEWLSPEARRQYAIGQWARSLWDEVLLKDEVVARVRHDRFLSEAERRQVLGFVDRYPSQANISALFEASWAVVHRPLAEAAAYRLALRQVEAVGRLIPDDRVLRKVRWLTAVGVAQYRVGRYAEALGTLTKSAEAGAFSDEWLHLVELAFLAMTYHRLGQFEQARDALIRLRERLKDPAFANDEEAQAYLREAATLLEGTMPRADP